MLEVPCAVEVNVSPRGQIGYPDEGIDAGSMCYAFFQFFTAVLVDQSHIMTVVASRPACQLEVADPSFIVGVAHHVPVSVDVDRVGFLTSRLRIVQGGLGNSVQFLTACNVSGNSFCIIAEREVQIMLVGCFQIGIASADVHSRVIHCGSHQVIQGRLPGTSVVADAQVIIILVVLDKEGGHPLERISCGVYDLFPVILVQASPLQCSGQSAVCFPVFSVMRVVQGESMLDRAAVAVVAQTVNQKRYITG